MDNYAYNNQYNNNSRKRGGFFLGFFVGGLTSFLICCILVVSGIVMYIVNKNNQDPIVGNSITDENVVEKMGMLEDKIQKSFWQDVDLVAIQDGAYKGMLDGLDDPYSVYYTQEEYKKMNESSKGVYYGIGAYMLYNKDTGYAKVTCIIKNTPAEESNLQVEDVIIKVDDEDMEGKEIDYVVSKIKGEKNTYVKLTVYRDGEDDYIDIEVQRREIEVPTIEYQMKKDNGYNLAYIQITQFDQITVSQFKEAMKNAREDQMQALIIDLRNNPGGNLASVCDISEQILPKGLIVYTKDKNGKREEYSCNGRNELDVPLVVLVNGNSASASEILAGAVKDYGIGKLVGEKTFGKGIVQSILPLQDGSAIKITTSTYYTPNGNNIHKIGIEPDVEVKLDKELLKEEEIDNQLNEAEKLLIEELKQR